MVFAQYFTNAMKTNEYSSGTHQPSQSQNLVLCARKNKTIGMMILITIGMMILKTIGMMILKTIDMVVLEIIGMMILKSIGMMVSNTIGMMILKTIGTNCSYVHICI